MSQHIAQLLTNEATLLPFSIYTNVYTNMSTQLGSYRQNVINTLFTKHVIQLTVNNSRVEISS